MKIIWYLCLTGIAMLQVRIHIEYKILSYFHTHMHTNIHIYVHVFMSSSAISYIVAANKLCFVYFVFPA